MSLELLADYIKKKVKRVNLTDPKSNTGAKLIKLYEGMDYIDDYTRTAVENIQHFFEFDSSDPGE